MSDALLQLDEVTYTYAGARTPAVRGVSLDVREGEFVVLAGLSASGKSTLLRAACGLVPHFHGGTFGGRCVVGGMDTRRHDAGDLAAVAGTLFQDPETQVVMTTVRAELAFPLENRGHGPAAVARGVEEVALALGLAHLLDRPTSELSGGELQRVALGAALAGRPPLVLLDEPTSQLDPVAGDELVWLLRRLNEEWGTAVVLAEHRLERCLAAADRLVVLQDGEVVCDAPPADAQHWAASGAPALQTPAARLFARAGLGRPPAGVKQARAALRAQGLLPAPQAPGATADDHSAPRRPRRAQRHDAALSLDGVWVELTAGRAVLRGVDLAMAPGERVALMGRNGAGKSTLLRAAGGLLDVSRGRVRARGRVALLLQNPNDFLLHERVEDEASPGALADMCLGHLAGRHPRDLSGGERQRLALAVVLDGSGPDRVPAAVLLDEPTRGMDRQAKEALADRLHVLAAQGSAVVVATHDAEFAATWAQRVVLLADGRPIADGTPAAVLSGGWWFTTETARILGGAEGALTPEQGADVLRRRMGVAV